MASWWEDDLADLDLSAHDDDGFNPFLDDADEQEASKAVKGANPFLRAFSVRKSRRLQPSVKGASSPKFPVAQPDPQPINPQDESFFDDLLAGLDEATDILEQSEAGDAVAPLQPRSAAEDEEDLNPFLCEDNSNDNPFDAIADDPEIEAVVDVLASLTGTAVSEPSDIQTAISKAREIPDDSKPLTRAMSIAVKDGKITRRTALNASWFVDKQVDICVACRLSRCMV